MNTPFQPPFEPLMVLAPLLIVGVPALLFLVFVLANYNRLVSIRQHVRDSWAGVDVELKRRYDLIPNLVEVVRGYATHEQQVLAEVTQLRTRAASQTADPVARGASEGALEVGVARLLGVAEAYPDLKADAHFLALQGELVNTEDRIAAARRFFNGNVRELNELCQAFPTNVLAGLFGFEPVGYFQTSSDAERFAPKVTGLS